MSLASVTSCAIILENGRAHATRGSNVMRSEHVVIGAVVVAADVVQAVIRQLIWQEAELLTLKALQWLWAQIKAAFGQQGGYGYSY